MPFSDPMAEGPVIQKACERALVHNTSLHDVLAMVKHEMENAAQLNVPLIVDSYVADNWMDMK